MHAIISGINTKRKKSHKNLNRGINVNIKIISQKDGKNGEKRGYRTGKENRKH